jgi:peptidoglycan/xylan/chitin deacetylase (PgdA/CDA1 family)
VTSASAKAAILAYHRVAELERDLHGLAVTPTAFRRQMEHLCDEYNVVSLRDLVAALHTSAVPDRTVAVTFDDGYLDNVTEAVPILEELDIPATFFVTTQSLTGSTQEFWWDRIARVLASSRHLPSTVTLDVDGRRMLWPTGTQDERLAAHWQLHALLLHCDADAREDILGQFAEWCGDTSPVKFDHRPMCATELISLSRRRRQEIAAHSVRHLMLPCQPADVQRAEIRDSRDQLEQLLDRRVIGFAYPFSAVDDQIEHLARQYFDFAVICSPEAVTAQSNIWRLPRLEVRSRLNAAFPDWLRSVWLS